MDDKRIFKLCMMISLIGVILLLFLANNLEPKLIQIKDISIKDLDNFVKVQGNITSLKILENMFILNIKDNQSDISVIGYGNLSVEKGTEVEIIGKVREYENRLEIEADEVRIK